MASYKKWTEHSSINNVKQIDIHFINYIDVAIRTECVEEFDQNVNLNKRKMEEKHIITLYIMSRTGLKSCDTTCLATQCVTELCYTQKSRESR